MPLSFGVDDEDEFHRARDQLLDQLAAAVGGSVDPEVVGDAGLLLDWRWGYSTGELDHYDRMDLEEYLIEWCPRKVSTGPEGYLPIIEGARTLIEHLARTGAWRGGPVQPLLGHLDEVTPRFIGAMSDPSNFGLAKGMFMGPALAGPDLDLDDPGSMQAAIDRFNALSFEERREMTDPLLDRMAGGGIRTEDDLAAMLAEHAVDLPKTPAPDVALVAEQAEAAPFIRQLHAVGKYLGPGKALTQTGNPKLVDARALVELFETDDSVEYTIGERTKTVRSANELPHLQVLLDVAIGAGALQDEPRKLRPDPDWDELSPVEQCEALLDAFLFVGPIEARSPTEFMSAVDGLLDAGILHWMVPVFLDGTIDVDEIVEQCLNVLAQEPGALPRVFETEEFRRSLVEHRVEAALDAMERCGVLTWTGFEVVPHRYGHGTDRIGGTVQVTELGRHLLPAHLLTVGYRARVAIDLRDATAVDVVDELDDAIDLDPGTAWSRWRPDDDAGSKFDALVDVLVSADTPVRRLGAVSLLSQAPEDVRTRRVTPLLDTDHAGYAVIVLEPPDGADDAAPRLALGAGTLGAGTFDDLTASLGPERSLRPVVDMFALELESDPDGFLDHLDELMPPNALTNLLTLLWRVPGPDSLALLEHLGQQHPVKPVAKAARKAAIQHRSRHGAS